MPERVWEECVLQGSSRPGANEIAQAGWISVVPVADASYVQRLHRELDLGESEAIALGQQLSTPVLIDERRGRMIARREGVAIIGTAGVLLQLKTQGALSAVRPIADDLISAGWRVSADLLQFLLASAGETPP